MQPIVAASPDSPALNHESARTMLHYLGSLSQDDNYQDLFAQLRAWYMLYISAFILHFFLTCGQTDKPRGLCGPPFLGELGIHPEIPSCQSAYERWFSGGPGSHLKSQWEFRCALWRRGAQIWAIAPQSGARPFLTFRC